MLIEQLQIAGFGVDGKSTDAAGLLAGEVVDLAHGVEELAVRMDGHKGRIDRLAGQGAPGQLARPEIEVKAIDTLAFLAGVGADVDPELVGLSGLIRGGRVRRHRKRGRQQRQENERPTP